jgi:hypothetical protein
MATSLHIHFFEYLHDGMMAVNDAVEAGTTHEASILRRRAESAVPDRRLRGL